MLLVVIECNICLSSSVLCGLVLSLIMSNFGPMVSCTAVHGESDEASIL